MARVAGRIGDALEVLLNHVKLDGLSQAEKDALSVLRGQLAAVRQVKDRTLTSVSASAQTSGAGALCPLLAQSGHPQLHRTCPLLGVKRTCLFALHMSAFDPKRTLVSTSAGPSVC
jgi:hypothetical protein